MIKRKTSTEMVSTRNKSKVLSCSTPEQRGESPSRDSDSICDSEAASPVPFLCTQDGAEGEIDVVWNYYTPKSHNNVRSRDKTSTPLSRKSKRSLRLKLEKQVPRRRAVKPSQKNTELFQELLELNQNVNEIMMKKQSSLPVKPQSGSEDDIFNELLDRSPKCGLKSSSRCLRRNVLSSNFGRPDSETALESDDSMNEYLLKASQMVEEKLSCGPVPAKRIKYENRRLSSSPLTNMKRDKDSTGTALNTLKLQSPTVSKMKKCDSPCINNDSFDRLVGNLDDSTLEQLTQAQIKQKSTKENMQNRDRTMKELNIPESSVSTKTHFGRHKSMPESPYDNKPSTSGKNSKHSNSDAAIESDDSMNECLLEASQVIEDKFSNHNPDSHRNIGFGKHRSSHDLKLNMNVKMDNNSMDAILNSMKLDFLAVRGVNKCDSPVIKDNSFDNLDGNTKTNALEQLTEMPIKAELSKSFSRYNSMPESPSVSYTNKPSTSGMVFGRFSSMPHNEDQDSAVPDSPTRCTIQEIKKKHQLARERLMAKRLLPFTPTQQTQPSSTQLSTNTAQNPKSKKEQFQLKVASSATKKKNDVSVNNNNSIQTSNNSMTLKELLEKKRQEALLKLRRRQPQNK